MTSPIGPRRMTSKEMIILKFSRRDANGDGALQFVLP